MLSVSIQCITKHYGQTRIINNLSLDVEESTFVCLLGSSGSGKTTILRLIAGLEPLDRGEIILNGKSASENSKILIPPFQRQIGLIFQDLALWPHFTVFENIAFGLKLKKEKNINSKISNMLDFFDISGHLKKYPCQLSGGQQQMVAIARSLVLNPRLLLMDEPLANLDVKLKVKIRNQIKKLIIEFPLTIIYVTHDHNEAFKLADKIVIINSGTVEATGTTQEIQNSENKFVRAFVEI